ncbi:MAG TPA: AMP-binding protein [Thermobifida alba]|nr:AMP-binding protein [Thermobifida alba]
MSELQSLSGSGWVRAETVGDLLDSRAEALGSEPALVFPEERATYQELAARADALARSMLAMGVDRGDRVGILMPACTELAALLFAAAKIGAVAVPVNARFKPVELEHIVKHSGMKVLFTAETPVNSPLELLVRTFPELADVTGGAVELPTLPELRRVVVSEGAQVPGYAIGVAEAIEMGGAISAEQVRARQSSVRLRDTMMLVYTSGTTAAPKGAMLSHEAVSRLTTGIVERLELTRQDNVWTAIPLFHGGGISFLISTLSAGATFVHPGLFDPATTLPLLIDNRVTVALAAFETIWLPVLSRYNPQEHDLTSIRAVMVVGVEERLRQMAEALPWATQVSCVAMTESCAFLSLHRLDDPFEVRVTTGGHPMPGMEVRVVDPETGEDLPPGAEGELLFRGPNAFDGYFRDPELTREVFDEEGWFHSGDVVRRDEDGRITFVSRLKDMLKVGGENVSAAEVEGLLITHPAVKLAQVVAAPDEYYVEVPAAFIELKPGQEATEEELIHFCLGKIATYRVPRYVRFVTEWPMSGTKIKKVDLRARIAEELKAKGITRAPRLDSRAGMVADTGGAGEPQPAAG